MSSDIKVGDTAYSLAGDEYLVQAVLGNGEYIGCLVYEVRNLDEGYYEEIDYADPKRVKLFAEIPRQKQAEWKRQLDELQAELNEVGGKLRKAKLDLIGADLQKEEAMREFPFLETALRIKKGELKYRVDCESGNYKELPKVVRIEDYRPYDCELVSFIYNHKTARIEMHERGKYFATEEEAKNEVRDQILATLEKVFKGYGVNSSFFTNIVRKCEKEGIKIPIEMRLKFLALEREQLSEDTKRYTGHLEAAKERYDKVVWEIEQLTCDK